MLIGDCFYFLVAGDGVGPMSNGGFDSDVSAEYAERASRESALYVRWTCTNGDPRDVRWFLAGEDVTERVQAQDDAQRRRATQAEIDKLSKPYDVLGARVQVRPAADGRVTLTIDGVTETYEPAEIRAKDGLSAEAVAAFDEVRQRALRVAALAQEVQS